MTAKNIFKTNLDNIYNQLTEVSDWMYKNPELGFKEFKTSEYLVKFIESFNICPQKKLSYSLFVQ